MDALALIRDQANNAESFLTGVFTLVTPEQATWRLPDSTANRIGTTFFHAYENEDGAVHGFMGSPTVFQRSGWEKRLGYDAATAWTFEGAQDPSLLLEYAREVAAVSKDYLLRITAEELERQIETPRGPRPLVPRLVLYLVSHKILHAGEIAALLGCQGIKGLPF